MIGAMVSVFTGFTIVYSIVYSGADQRKLCVTGLCAGNSPRKWPVKWEIFPFDDVIMLLRIMLLYKMLINMQTWFIDLSCVYCSVAARRQGISSHVIQYVFVFGHFRLLQFKLCWGICVLEHIKYQLQGFTRHPDAMRLYLYSGSAGENGYY